MSIEYVSGLQPLPKLAYRIFFNLVLSFARLFRLLFILEISEATEV